MRRILKYPRKPALFLIRVYQKFLSPDHGPLRNKYPYGYCKYYPSCSQYSYEIIEKKGLVVGVPKSVWRILRCNPFSEGGIDEPYEKEKTDC